MIKEIYTVIELVGKWFILYIFRKTTFFVNKVFRQRIEIPMGTNCAHLNAGLFLY